MTFICIYHPSLWTFTCFGRAPCLIVYAPESHTLSNYRVRLVSGKEKKKKNYSLHGHTLEHVPSAKYLGVDLKWESHITNISQKANKTIGFLKRNLNISNGNIKEKAYISLVCLRPTVEYASPVWDPYMQKNKYKIEMVQRRAARYVTNRYHICP